MQIILTTYKSNNSVGFNTKCAIAYFVLILFLSYKLCYTKYAR